MMLVSIGQRIESSGHLGTVTKIEKSGVTIQLDIGQLVVIPLDEMEKMV